ILDHRVADHPQRVDLLARRSGEDIAPWIDDLFLTCLEEIERRARGDPAEEPHTRSLGWLICHVGPYERHAATDAGHVREISLLHEDADVIQDVARRFDPDRFADLAIGGPLIVAAMIPLDRAQDLAPHIIAAAVRSVACAPGHRDCLPSQTWSRWPVR